jgi:hypothetical protein
MNSNDGRFQSSDFHAEQSLAPATESNLRGVACSVCFVHLRSSSPGESGSSSWEGAILRMKVGRSRAALDRFKEIVFKTVFSKPNSRSK